MQKRKHLILCLLLIAIILTAGMSIKSTVYASNTQTDKIIKSARSLLGSTKFDWYCQKFVRLCYEAGGCYATTSAESAISAWYKWGVSSSSDDIPVGACVYFTSGSVYGHVGIYTGEGKMIHAVSTVREEPISNYGWSKYLGWGYQGGKIPSGSYTEINKNTLDLKKAAWKNDDVTLTWDKLNGASGYRIYRKDPETGKWKKIKTVKSATKKTYTDTSTVEGTTYQYRARAYVEVGDKNVFSKYSKALTV